MNFNEDPMDIDHMDDEPLSPLADLEEVKVEIEDKASKESEVSPKSLSKSFRLNQLKPTNKSNQYRTGFVHKSTSVFYQPQSFGLNNINPVFGVYSSKKS